ncbi:ABC transporter permease [Methanosarcinales archaeon]|nr:MAG: ABC transporter permease [Methanosarcinales archaeon]
MHMNIITKVVSYVLIIFIILSLNFFLPRMMPAGPLSDSGITSSNESVLEEYINYMVNLVHGELGWSTSRNAPVWDVLKESLKWTVLLVGTSTAIYVIAGILTGAVSAWKKGKKSDAGLLVLLISLASFPPFFLGMLFIVFLAWRLDIFPRFGAQTLFIDYSTPFGVVLDILHHLILPAATLTLTSIGVIYLLTRNSMLNVLGEDYILAARAKGLSEWYIMRKHALKNALLPIITMVALVAGFVITGTIFVETVFAYPGVGVLVYEAVQAHDYPLLQGAFLIIALAILAVNFIADMVYVHLDPRVREE